MAHVGVRGDPKWRTAFGPGDIGSLIRLHGILYTREYGYDRTFEAYVAAGLADFVLGFDPSTDRLWLVERRGRIVASVAIVGRARATAQLRWYLVHPDFRGRGLGRRLLRAAVRFCKSRGRRRIYLWTASELDAARHLYTGAGFRRTRKRTHDIWGKRNEIEERYDLVL
jgi:ribosomal protein S18 acetylase RimI-like enzyme